MAEFLHFLTTTNGVITTIATFAGIIVAFFTSKKIILEIKEKKYKIIMAQKELDKLGKEDLKAQLTASTYKLDLSLKTYTKLLGRDEEIDKIMTALRRIYGKQFISISGLGGIGKTALAYEITQLSLHENLFKDTIWMSSKQEELIAGKITDTSIGQITLESLTNKLYKYWGLSENNKTVEDKKLEIKQMFRANPYLIVLDNLETAPNYIEILKELYQWLIPSRAIVTTRPQITDIDYTYPIHLNGLDETSSILLMRQEARDRNFQSIINAQETSLKKIYIATGGSPLAIKLIVGQLAKLPLEIVLENLKNTGEDIYDFIYLDSWKALSIDAQKILIAMLPFDTAASVDALMKVSTVKKASFYNALKELITMSLIEATHHLELESKKYTIHQLTRNFINSDLPKLWEKQKK